MVAAMEYATKRAQAKRMSSGAYHVLLQEETEEESDDVEDSEESEDEEVQEQSESAEEEEEEPKEEDIEIEQEDEDEGEEEDDEGADEDDKRQEQYLAETSADEESREKISGILAEARALLDEGQMPATEEKKSKEKSSGSTVGMDALLPDSGRTVTPVTSVLMHRSIQLLESSRWKRTSSPNTSRKLKTKRVPKASRRKSKTLTSSWRWWRTIHENKISRPGKHPWHCWPKRRC